MPVYDQIQDPPPYGPITTTPQDEESLGPGVPVPPEQDVTSAQTPPPPPLILRGPQGPAPTPTGPPLQLLTPEQASQQEMMRRAQYAYAADPTAQTEQAVAAALKFQAQRMYQQDLASGTAPAEAIAKVAPLLFGGPKQGNLGQAASFIKATQKPAPKFTDVGGVLYRHNPDGSVTAVTGPKVPGMTPYQQAQIKLRQDAAARPRLSETEKALLGADVTELKGLEKQIGGTEEHGFGLLHPLGGNKSQMDALRKKAADLRQKIQTQYGGKSPTLPPAPRVAKDRVTGQTYLTPKGPHTWTGTGWKTVQDLAGTPAAPDEDGDEEDSNAE